MENIPQLLVLGSVTAPITVTVNVSSPDAVNGTDYTIANTIIPIGAYDGLPGTAVPINLFIIDDGNTELLETLTLTIQPPAGPLNQIGDANSDTTTQNPSTYDIIDDDMGPGGVADRVLFWYRADIGTSTTTDNVGVQTWFDQLTIPASVDAFENTVNQRPTYQDEVADEINFNPVLRFDGINDQLELPDTSFVNLSQTPFKVMHIVFHTGADVVTTQNIYEEGAGVRGFDAYIQNNEVSFGDLELC